MTLPPDDPTPPPPRRPLRTWLLLLIVWTIGLCVWVLYFMLAGWIVLKVF